MADPPVLEVSGVSKHMTREPRRGLRYAVADVRRDLIPRRDRSLHRELREGEVAVVDDVSFELRRGESLALIGANGAGKTTLLKLIFGLLKPSRGKVVAHGRVGALIELGTGFDPVLTGRENIALNGAMVGLSPARLRSAVDQIVEFADLGELIDAPVRTYSSGTAARLAFAVAALLEPDVLLVDEVLAVGDVEFQRKCLAHMQRFIGEGGALILVSHNTPEILAMCDRGMLLESGRSVLAGATNEVLSRYFERSLRASRSARPALGALEPADGVVVVGVDVTGQGGEVPVTGEPAEVRLTYSASTAREVLWGFTVLSGDEWTALIGANNLSSLPLRPGSGTLQCTLPRLPLLTGRYGVRATIVDASTRRPLARYGYQEPPAAFYVTAPATAAHNGLAAEGHLMTVDVDWN
jgi:lipopolysaccharide transport system ATP-binding protein